MHAELTASAHSPLVLVVDDQPFFRAHIRHELLQRGHTVVTAHDALQAEQLIDEVGPPLVVILDLMLPGRSGPELLHALGKRPDADGLRFILVSAYHVLDKVAPNHRLVVGRLEKPVDAGLLAEKVAEAGAALRPTER